MGRSGGRLRVCAARSGWPEGSLGIRAAPAEEGAGHAVGDALAAVAGWLAAEGVDVIAADPEVAEDDEPYALALRANGFRAIPEIQPSRHRMALGLAGADEVGAFSTITRATRQRIRQAERSGVAVVRHDADLRDREGFLRPGRDGHEALERFHSLMVEMGRRRGFAFPGRGDFLGWWRRSLAAGHVVLLEAREGGVDGDVLGGLLLYRHGSRLSTQHAADLESRRSDQPGTMHLLRWRAIQLAIAEGRAEMDLGGVDVPGARHVPAKGDPAFGLYEHKRSFGADWVGLAGAHERVVRPWRYAAGRATARAARVLGRPRRAAARQATPR